MLKDNPDCVLVVCGSPLLDAQKKIIASVANQVEVVPENDNSIISYATGLFLTGKKVLVFGAASRVVSGSYNVIRETVCSQKLPITIIGAQAGVTSVTEESLCTPCFEDFALMRLLPHMQVLSPHSNEQTMEMILYAMKSFEPTYIRFHAYDHDLFAGTSKVPFEPGKGDVLLQGDKLNFFVTGALVQNALHAAEILKKEKDISIQVVNISSLKPLDKKLVYRCALETERIVTLEDHSVCGGLGAAISEVLEKERPREVLRLGLEDVFPEKGFVHDLYDKHGFLRETLAKTLFAFLEKEEIL